MGLIWVNIAQLVFIFCHNSCKRIWLILHFFLCLYIFLLMRNFITYEIKYCWFLKVFMFQGRFELLKWGFKVEAWRFSVTLLGYFDFLYFKRWSDSLIILLSKINSTWINYLFQRKDNRKDDYKWHNA